MGVAAKMIGVATTTNAAGVTAHRVLVCLRAPPRGEIWSSNLGSWPQLWRRQRRAEDGAGERSAWDGLSTFSRSSSASNTDHNEVVMVEGKKCQETWQKEHLGLMLSPSCCAC